MSDEMDRQQEVEARMRKSRTPETVKIQLRKITTLVFCSNAGKLRSTNLCKGCKNFYGWFQDDDGTYVKCGDITKESKAIEVLK